MAKWFGAHYNQEIRFSSGVKCNNKGPQVLTSLLQDESIIIIIQNVGAKTNRYLACITLCTYPHTYLQTTT